MKPHGSLYHGLWKVFDEDNFKLLIDSKSKKPAVFTSSIAAISAAKKYVISLQPEIKGCKIKTTDKTDILGVGAFFDKKAEERSKINLIRKRKKLKPFEVEVRGNGKKTYT